MIPKVVSTLFWAGLATGLTLAASSSAEIVSATIAKPAPAETGYFKLGTTKNPAGHELSLNSRSLLLDGQPWFPVMGEFHYTRVPAAEWREELLKMKAGGIDIVATYVFWIHHEEIEGQWDWSERRDLKKFVQTCNEVGLKVLVRCGPWCHGEVRNGGFPDWVQAHKDWKLRSTDTNFLAAVKGLYTQIATQLHGEYWKDGGAVIGIQVDNEFRGSPAYLMALKQLAIGAGIDVPYYTKTGWPPLPKPLPLGELMPLFGGYADGFWLRDTTAMPGDEWKKYLFSGTRTDAAIGVDQLGKQKARDQDDISLYPYLCCEIGGGMETSYHRRIWLRPEDTESLVLAQFGSGTSLLGYYMYHGGQNPEGKLTTLNESQASGYPNDLPVKSYDFNAPIGEYGQLALCGLELGVPAIFAAGEQALCEEATALTPGVVTVAVKRGLLKDGLDHLTEKEYRAAKLSAVHLSPSEARQRIEAGAKAAAEKLSRNPAAFRYPVVSAPYVRRERRRGGVPEKVTEHPTSLIALFNQP